MTKSNNRSLRNPTLRDALFSKAGGKCSVCKSELVDGWHADHIVPWSVSKRTNIFEMQALCAACNLAKGTKMNLRKHQQMLSSLGQSVANGQTKPSIIADITPGGGKSAGIGLFFRPQIESGMINHVLWACPRKALVSQCYEAWEKWSGLPASLLTAVHYDQISRKHLDLVDSKRVGLAADELQFLCDCGDSTWARNMELLREKAVSFLGVSGTLERNNRRPLLGVPYANGNSCPELTGPQYDREKQYAIANVSYNLRDALYDTVVCPFDIRQELGRVTIAGETYNIFDPESNELSGVLQPYLENPNTWRPIIDNTIDSWLAYRQSHYRSKMIVVASSQIHAENICSHLVSRRIRCCLAISDNPNATYEIDDFKFKKFNSQPYAMITVAMASVGLDVPDVSHLAYLTHYRFAGWMLQAWARASRICYDCGVAPEKQVAFISTVRDPRMDQFVDWIKSQSPKGITNRLQAPIERESEGGSENEGIVVQDTELVGCEFETSDIRQGIGAQDSSALAMLIKAAPVLASVDKNVLRQIAPGIDTAKISGASVVEPPSWRHINETQSKIALAIRNFVGACVCRLAKEKNAEQSHVRSQLYDAIVDDGYRASISDFALSPSGRGTLIQLMIEAAERVMQCGISSISYSYRIETKWSDAKQKQHEQRYKDLASLMTDLLTEFEIPVRVIARKRT